MPTDPRMDDFVNAHIKSGQYANASEVLRAGLRALAPDEKEDAARIESIRNALRMGELSGIAPEGSFDRIRANFDKLESEMRASAKL